MHSHSLYGDLRPVNRCPHLRHSIDSPLVRVLIETEIRSRAQVVYKPILCKGWRKSICQKVTSCG